MKITNLITSTLAAATVAYFAIPLPAAKAEEAEKEGAHRFRRQEPE